MYVYYMCVCLYTSVVILAADANGPGFNSPSACAQSVICYLGLWSRGPDDLRSIPDRTFIINLIRHFGSNTQK